MSQLSGHLVEEVGLRLGPLFVLQDGDLLGHKTTQMGAKREHLNQRHGIC